MENPTVESNGWGKGGGRDFHLIMFCLGQRDRKKFGISPGPLWVLVCIFSSLKYIDLLPLLQICGFSALISSSVQYPEPQHAWSYIFHSQLRKANKTKWMKYSIMEQKLPPPSFSSDMTQGNDTSSELLYRRISPMKEMLSVTSFLCDTGKWYLCGTKSVQLGTESESKCAMMS